MNLDVAVHILRLDCHEQGPKPFKGSKVSADPEEIHLPQPAFPLRVSYSIPDAFEDGCKRSDADSSSNEDCYFIFEDVFRRASERPVDENTWQNFPKRRIDIHVRRMVINTDHGGFSRVFLRLTFFEIAADRSG